MARFFPNDPFRPDGAVGVNSWGGISSCISDSDENDNDTSSQSVSKSTRTHIPSSLFTSRYFYISPSYQLAVGIFNIILGLAVVIPILMWLKP